MKTPKERVEAHVRSLCPETKGSSFEHEIEEATVHYETGSAEFTKKEFMELFDRPLQLHHFLKVLGYREYDYVDDQIVFDWNTVQIKLPLTPPSDWPDDVYEKLAEILNV